VTRTTFQELLLTPFNVHEILGFQILSSEKHFCHWEISEILLRVRGLDPWSANPANRSSNYPFPGNGYRLFRGRWDSKCWSWWGWVFLERTRSVSGIQFTTRFIEIFVVETKRFIGSSLNVILTRQTCGQRSSRAAERKRRALGNYFLERNWYMFLMSKCRGDLGLCTFWVLAKRESLRNAKFRFFLRAKHVFFRKSPLRCGSLNASTEIVHRPRSQSLLHFDIRNIQQIHSGK